MAQVVGTGSVHSTSLFSCPSSGSGMREDCLRKFLKPAPFSSRVLPRKGQRGGGSHAPVVAVLKKMSRVEMEVLPVSPEDVRVVRIFLVSVYLDSAWDFGNAESICVCSSNIMLC